MRRYEMDEVGHDVRRCEVAEGCKKVMWKRRVWGKEGGFCSVH